MTASDDDLADLADLVLNLSREIRFRGYDDRDAVDLTVTEGNVMRFIDRHPGSSPSDVAHGTGLQRSNLSTALKSLEQKGLVARSSDPADARGVRLLPTELAASNLAIIRREWAAHLRAALGDETRVDVAVDVLARLDAGVVAVRQRDTKA